MRGEAREPSAEELAAEDGLSAEKQQEQLLMSKLASSGKLPARPASSFLQKKLQQRKYFDSGDYAMDKDRAKQNTGATDRPHPLATAAGEAAESTEPAAETAASPPSAAHPPALSPEPTAEAASNDDSLLIPRPDTVPQRKASIINPGVQCKLSPQPHVHHDAVPEC